MCVYESPRLNASSAKEEDRSHRNRKIKDENVDDNEESSSPVNYWFKNPIANLFVGTVLAVGIIAFSLYFPFLLAPEAALETYHFAFYDYEPDTSHFDNSFWTYGTDYMLALVMGILILCTSTSHKVSRQHALRSRGLLLCYMLSVAAGGLAHQFYTTLESRNTASFRFLWTLCVGTVTAASGFMGIIGTELVRKDRQDACKQSWLPVIPEIFWVAYGVAASAIVVCGGLSHQRPACDIFIAGISQSPSTAYVMIVLSSGLPVHKVKKWARVGGCIGFIMNAPLLPLYPLLVQYTSMSLAAVNTLLHTWLCIAWSLQGLALRHVGQCLEESKSGPPFSARPVKSKKGQ